MAHSLKFRKRSGWKNSNSDHRDGSAYLLDLERHTVADQAEGDQGQATVAQPIS